MTQASNRGTWTIAALTAFSFGCDGLGSENQDATPPSSSDNGDTITENGAAPTTTLPAGDGDGATASEGGDGDASSDDGDTSNGDGDGDGDSAMLCSEECAFANDGECDDGGEGSASDACWFGTDCADCGSRVDNGEIAGGPWGDAACGDGEPGRGIGDSIEDFTLSDQNGGLVSLSDYCGQVVYIPLGAMWCPGCASHAEEIPRLMKDYGEQGLIVLNLMAESVNGSTPNQEELTAWADSFDITTPVLADTDWGVWGRYWPNPATPQSMLVDREGKITALGWVSLSDVEDAL